MGLIRFGVYLDSNRPLRPLRVPNIRERVHCRKERDHKEELVHTLKYLVFHFLPWVVGRSSLLSWEHREPHYPRGSSNERVVNDMCTVGVTVVRNFDVCVLPYILDNEKKSLM